MLYIHVGMLYFVHLTQNIYTGSAHIRVYDRVRTRTSEKKNFRVKKNTDRERERPSKKKSDETNK